MSTTKIYAQIERTLEFIFHGNHASNLPGIRIADVFDIINNIASASILHLSCLTMLI